MCSKDVKLLCGLIIECLVLVYTCNLLLDLNKGHAMVKLSAVIFACVVTLLYRCLAYFQEYQQQLAQHSTMQCLMVTILTSILYQAIPSSCILLPFLLPYKSRGHSLVYVHYDIHAFNCHIFLYRLVLHFYCTNCRVRLLVSQKMFCLSVTHCLNNKSASLGTERYWQLILLHGIIF